jgi:HSP20 family protein
MTKFLLNDFWLTDLSQIFDYNTTSTVNISKPKDFIEFEKHYEFNLAVPGLTKEDIKVSLNGDLLDVSYAIEKTEGKTYFVYSNFKKSLVLPKDSDKQNIEAEVKNGILTIVVPKQIKKTTEPKQIEVK